MKDSEVKIEINRTIAQSKSKDSRETSENVLPAPKEESQQGKVVTDKLEYQIKFIDDTPSDESTAKEDIAEQIIFFSENEKQEEDASQKPAVKERIETEELLSKEQDSIVKKDEGTETVSLEDEQESLPRVETEPEQEQPVFENLPQTPTPQQEKQLEPAFDTQETIEIEILSSKEPEEDRYTRIVQLGWDPNILKEANILVVGAGALGNEALKNLALLGVGNILVADMDTIEDSNLTRSVLFRQHDVGKYKAEVAANEVKDINPDVKIKHFCREVQNALGLGVYRRLDVVLGCLDNRQARLDVGKSCWLTKTPYIDGGLDYLNGDVSVFISPDTACYGCTLSEEARKQTQERHSCLKVRFRGDQPTIPTAPTISSIIAGWQTQIAIKYLHGEKIPAGKRIGLMGIHDQIFEYTITKNPQCFDHLETIQEEDIIELQKGVEELTLGEFIAEVRRHPELGGNALVEFDFDFLESAVCYECEQEKKFFKRLDDTFLDEVLCPKCNKIMSFIFSFVFDGSESYADKKLSELGVPPLNIIGAKNSDTMTYKYFELSGDLQKIFGD